MRKPGKGKSQRSIEPKQARTDGTSAGAASPEDADRKAGSAFSKQAGVKGRPITSKRDSTNGLATSLPVASGATTSARFPVVGIGASAGGLEAFSDLLRHLPEKTGMAFVLVQHLDPTHGSALKEILSRVTKIPVTEVKDGVVVEPNHIYVIPANTNMSVSEGVLRLAARTLTQGQHMPINYFMNSLAADRGDQAICVILSGTASDGTEGCAAVKTAGGIIFAQDEKSAKYPSMPRNAIMSGCVDFVMPPASIAQELARIGRHPYVASDSGQKSKPVEPTEGRELETILSMVQDSTGVDFAHYKQSTMQRRIKRRMVLHQIEHMRDYLRYIKRNPQEIDQLYRDILIHVTGFFRDPEAFEALRTVVLPGLFTERRPEDPPVRVWVPGCSTGEEVYSIAICMLEYLWEEARSRSIPSVNKGIQIFATDISDPALERARAGLYSEASVAGVSAERLKRFFLRTDGGYQINKAVREMCIFARQNVVKDPPFSNLDLVSCRNLLIYLGPELQKRLVPMLHYGLKPGSYLMLGGSESLGAFADHFTLVDKKNKIYQKKRSGARLISYFSGADYMPHKIDLGAAKAPHATLSIERDVERTLLNRFAPASIVVNSDMEIVQFRGKTGAYLEPAAGNPTFSLSKMAREGLLVDLRAALNRAKKENLPVRREGIRIQSNGGTRNVDIDVIPIHSEAVHDRFYVVAFQDSRPLPAASERGRKPQGKGADEAAARRERERAAEEVRQLREQLQALIEDHETTLEEFKSANEEVLSGNEELQSTNEELETAKEELQSTNEELSTLNEELQTRNTELSIANNDLVNLFASANLPVVIVGNDMRIRRFTPPAQKLMNLLPGDMGRRLGEIRPNLEIESVEQLAREVIDSAAVQEVEVQEVESGGWYLMRVRPYRTWENKIDGAVISFQDIDSLKRNLDQVRRYSDALIENAREPNLVLDRDLHVTVGNSAFYRAFQVSREETEGKPIYELGNGQWNIPSLRKLLDVIVVGDTRVDDFRVEHEFPGIGRRTMLLNARRVEALPGKPMILLSIEDLTEETKHIEALRKQATMLELANDGLLACDLEGKIEYWNRGAEELYGWTKEQAVGKCIWDLLRTEFPTPLSDAKAELLRTGRWEGELVHTRGDGSKRIVSSRWALQNADGPNPLIFEINTDITDRKSSEGALRKLSARLMRVQDEERRRIARELHDSLGQRLTALKINLGMVQAKLDPNSKEYSSVAECMNFADESMQEIRTMSQLLHPPLIDEAGLSSAIQWLVQGFSSRSGIKVDLSLPEKLARMPQDIELALFRVLQEALNNVNRHSEAKSVQIQLIQEAGAAIMKISDDGKGIPVELLKSSSGVNRPFGVGVLGMKERLAQFGGKLTISNGGKGAVVTAEVPIPAKQEVTKTATS
jgi:two-component system, chemotaxis family, CheB/CheR fusion protein